MIQAFFFFCCEEIVENIAGVIDPAKLVLLKLSTPAEKECIIKNGPNQSDKSVSTCISTKRQPAFRH